MPIRSRYSSNSYNNTRPGSATHADKQRENRINDQSTVEAIPAGSYDVCQTCPYKRIVESSYQPGSNAGIVVPAPATAIPAPVTSATIPDTDKKPDEKPGFFSKFQKYVANNQAANRKAGDTSLTEDLVKWGGNLASGAAALGQEEMNYIENKKKTRNVSRKDRVEEDEDTLDFLMGKKRTK